MINDFTKQVVDVQLLTKMNQERRKNLLTSLYSYKSKKEIYSVPWDKRNSNFFGYDLTEPQLETLNKNIVKVKESLKC